LVYVRRNGTFEYGKRFRKPMGVSILLGWGVKQFRSEWRCGKSLDMVRTSLSSERQELGIRVGKRKRKGIKSLLNKASIELEMTQVYKVGAYSSSIIGRGV